jgi:hypothetical protein
MTAHNKNGVSSEKLQWKVIGHVTAVSTDRRVSKPTYHVDTVLDAFTLVCIDQRVHAV